MTKEIEGEIKDLEYSGYWGGEVGTVICPECESSVPVGGMSNSYCSCGYDWVVETRAVGRKEIEW